MLPNLTAEATLVADPEVRFAPSGQAWARMRLVCNDRVKDAQGQWTDGDPFFFSAVVFGKPAENLAESALKGDRLVISGRAKWNEWETQEGEKRKDLEVVCESIAVGLLFGAAKTDRMRGEHTSGSGRAASGTGSVPDPFTGPFGSAPQEKDPPF